MIGKNYPDLSFTSPTGMHDWCLWVNSLGLAFIADLPNEGSVWTHLRDFVDIGLADYRRSYEKANGSSQEAEDSDDEDSLSSMGADRFDTLKWVVWWSQPRRGKKKAEDLKLTTLSPADDMNPATCTVARLTSGGTALYNGWNAYEEFYGLPSIVIGLSFCSCIRQRSLMSLQHQNASMCLLGL